MKILDSQQIPAELNGVKNKYFAAYNKLFTNDW